MRFLTNKQIYVLQVSAMSVSNSETSLNIKICLSQAHEININDNYVNMLGVFGHCINCLMEGKYKFFLVQANGSSQ